MARSRDYLLILTVQPDVFITDVFDLLNEVRRNGVDSIDGVSVAIPDEDTSQLILDEEYEEES